MNICMPKLNETGETAAVLEIFVQVGDQIEPGQKVLSAELEKAIVEVESLHRGRVARISVRSGDEVAVGAVLIELDAVA